ncbi:MAG: response regulator [Candidatus Nomurabacteria bacterium]|nr:response regulator [Candidatus Nomurabacteria bacterium]
MKKILIVEDTLVFIDMIIIAIKNISNYADIIDTSTEEEARELLRTEKFDLIIIDGNLAPGNGENLLPDLTDEQKEVTLVYSSSVDMIKKAVEMNIRCVLKHCSRDEFDMEIKKTLSR